MPIFPFPLVPNCRAAKLTVEQATDVILNCTEPSQDAMFAEKYDVTSSCIGAIRKRRTWFWLRQKLETGWRP